MEFRLLGPFEAWHRDLPVELGDLQQRYALAVLVLHANKPVSADRLIDIVWGRSRPRTNLVTGYIARLRKAFREAGAEDVAIETTATGYVLRVDRQCLDTVRFTELCARAATVRDTGASAEAARLLHEAIGLWRGRFLEDLDIDRIGGAEVVTLDEALLDALGDLAELELAAGNHRWVRDRLRPHVRDDPSRQRLAVLLMRALIANGDRVEAMKVYHGTRDALDEYGMETSPELRDLAWLAQYGGQRSTLPPRPARFTGRTEELAAIEAAAQSAADAGEPAVVWLSGTPGVGKTALAVEAAARLAKRFPDARLFIALNGFTPNVEPTEPGEALAMLLLDLGVPAERIPPTITGRIALYQDKLAGTKTLVVLDNAADEAQIRPLVPQAPGGLAIVTSRKAGDLEAADNLRLAPLPAADAAELFGKLAGADRVRGRGPQVDEVVRRCGWLPLQIRVVASQFRRHHRWPLDHLVRLLSGAGPWREGTGFDDGIRACRVSYEQLDEPQRSLFWLLGLIPGADIGVPAAGALAGRDPLAARALLDELHGVSLLEEAVPDRYHLLDPLRDFAASVPHPDPREAVTRLLDFYLVTTSAAIAAAFPFDREQQPTVTRMSAWTPEFDDRKDALAWLAAERLNLVAAIRYAASHEYPEHTWQLAVLLWRYFNTVGYLKDWTETLELARQTVMADPDNPCGQAYVLLRLSTVRWRSGRLAHALELAAQALPRWVRLADARGEANSLCAIAMPTMELGDHELAIAHFEAALGKYEQVGDERGQAYVLSHLGYLNELHGNLEPAKRQQLAAVGLLRAIGHTQGLAHALDNLGSVRQRLGRLDEAMASHEEALAIAVEIGDRSLEAYTLNYIGNVHRLRDRLEDAVRFQDEARKVANTVTDANLRTQLYLDRAATCRARGEPRAALETYQAALDLAAGTGDRGQRAHAGRGIAQALHDIGEHHQAAEQWHAAETAFADLNLPEAIDIRKERNALHCPCRPAPASPQFQNAESPFPAG